MQLPAPHYTCQIHCQCDACNPLPARCLQLITASVMLAIDIILLRIVEASRACIWWSATAAAACCTNDVITTHQHYCCCILTWAIKSPSTKPTMLVHALVSSGLDFRALL